jgi:hypothetical protein
MTGDTPANVEKLMDDMDIYMRKAHDFSVKRKTANYSRGMDCLFLAYAHV